MAETGTEVCKRRHRWAVVDQKREPSAYELMSDRLKSFGHADEWFFQASYVVTYRCADCGLEEVRRA